MSSEDIKTALYESIENIDDRDFLMAIKQLIDRKYRMSDVPGLTDWQVKRIGESYNQIENGKCFSNQQADLLVEQWLGE